MIRLITLCCVVLISQSFAVTVEEWTHSYDKLLKTYVVKDMQGRAVVTSFKYNAARNAKATTALRTELATVTGLDTLDKNERLAFWLNAYNFLAIDTVIRNPGIKKLTDLNKLFKSVWKQDAGTVASKIMSLDGIEHGLIRKQFAEPRIHVALVCAAHSCPNLRWEAYRGKDLDAQLNDQMTDFIANSKKGLRIDAADEELYLSSIFDWFEDDFPGGPKAWLVAKGFLDSRYKGYSVEYLDYDWLLNSAN